MTCILKACAHGAYGACKTLEKAGLGDCGAAYALDLASRNDGYLVHGGNNPTISALVKAGLVTVRRVGDDGKYVIARAVHVSKPGYHQGKPALERAAQIGRGINLAPAEEMMA